MGEVLDDFFADGKWDNYEQNGVTYVSYTGIGQNTQTGEKIVIGIYFKLNSDKTFGIDRMTWNGDTMNTLEQLGVISALNDSYRESHGLASSNALDSAFDELENALDDALADSSSKVRYTMNRRSIHKIRQSLIALDMRSTKTVWLKISISLLVIIQVEI